MIMDLLAGFSFAVPTRIIYGAGVSKGIDKVMGRIGSGNVLLITDPGVRQAGLTTTIEQALSVSGATVTVFDGVEPNPRDTTVDRAAEAGREAQASAIVAVGGGSVIDTAKAAGILMTSGGKIQDYEGRGRVSRPIPPLVAVPTTAGTGSEVSFSSVITDMERKYKLSVNSPLSAALIALIDPELTVTLPPALTASTGMDALTHAIEAMIATCSNPISHILGLSAIGLIAGNLRTAVQDGTNLPARSAVLLGSVLAGMAFANADVAAVHCMAEALGGMYDTPHGTANSIFLPYVLDYNVEAVPERLMLAAQAMGEDISGLGLEQAARKAVAAIERLSSDVGIPRFSELNIPQESLPELADRSAQNGSVSSNPRPITRDDFLALFHRALAGPVCENQPQQLRPATARDYSSERRSRRSGRRQEDKD